ncbi:MAG: homocitrate synthase [Proteobacteria bacterium]|nr:homocitrate synthase [Pseudomonadota bacterium]
MAKKNNRIYIIDVTNRDGVQTSRLGLAKLQKTIINILLNEMGVYQSEFGFPVTHHETHYLNANLKLAKMGILKPIILSGWIRAIVSDVKQALELTEVEHLNISASTSKQMIRGKYRGKRSGDDVIKDMTNALDYARTHGIKTIGVNAEDASRTELEYLIKFASAAKDHGADRFRYCDTLGYDDPFTIYNRIKAIAQKVKIPIELHCHNDLGLVVANSIAGAKAAIDAGVDAYINTSVNGMGERAGNADLVSVILAIQKSSGFEDRYMLDERVTLSKSWQIATYASYAFGVDIPINQPGVGANAFAHESGIHADGALKDRHNYELYDYQELGLGEPEVIDTGRKITAGEYSGIKGFRNVYEKLEIRFHDDEEATKILELVRYANVHTQKPLVKKELLFIARYPDIVKEIMTFTPLE